MQNKRPSHHFVSCEIQIDNCYFMSYNIYNNVGSSKTNGHLAMEKGNIADRIVGGIHGALANPER